jgi:hypothetical protein
LLEQLASGRSENDNGLTVLRQKFVEGLAPGLWLHQHPRATTVRAIVDCLVLVMRVVAQVVNLNV